MANKEQYLDEAGLRLYNDLIKAYINKKCSVNGLDSLIELGEKVKANSDAIEILNGEGPDSVKGKIKAALETSDFSNEIKRLDEQTAAVYAAIKSIEEENITGLFDITEIGNQTI